MAGTVVRLHPPHFAPNCRSREHTELEHHARYATVVGKECECPCHGGNGPWWPDVRRAS